MASPCFYAVPSATRLPDGHLRKILWGAKIAKSHPTVSYEDTMDESDQGLYKWLSNIVRDTEDGKCATDDCIGPVWVLPRFWSSRHSRSNGRVVEAHWVHSRNTMQVYHLPFLVCDIEVDCRRQVLGIYSRSFERRHGIHHDGTWGTHRQHLLCSC